MGKVIINEQHATETARSESVERSQTEKGLVPVERTRAKSPRSLMVANNPSDKQKNAGSRENRLKNLNKSAATKVNVEAGGGKPKDITASRKRPATQVKILESTKVVQEPKKVPVGAAAAAIDPELALMQSRSATAAKSRDDAVKLQTQMGNGKVMSDMVRRPMARRAQPNAAANNVTAQKADAAPEEESTFSKMRSALIGVGVAVVVAVIGFVCIGIFGNNKAMCVVQFESNGGTQVEGTEIVCGRTVSQPEDPEKEGFTFQGWMQDGELFNFEETPLYKNAILVARWQANEGTEVVKVKFDTDGGSTMDEIELAKGSKLYISTVPTKYGYVFDDWYLGDKPYDFDQPVTEDITLKATWTKQQPIVNNNNNGNTNNNKPTVVKVASLSAGGMSIANVGDSATVNVSVLPTAAEYALKVVSGNEAVASCSVSGNVVTCKANGYGNTSVKVQDTNSGVMTTFNVVVDKPDIEPEPVDPKPVEPEPIVSHTLTIRYVDASGNVLKESYTGSFEKGKPYSVDSPALENYITETGVVSGTMGDTDVTIDVVYKPVETPQPTPDPTPTPGPEPEKPAGES